MKTILYFTASWCGPCKALAPRMEKLASQINYRKIDVDSNQDMSIKYGVRNVPSLVLVDENGTELNRMVGVQPDQAILNFYNG
jgi:thioredoxin 1|tara:strand:- start:220 stop:468 length:249 start_codon:yes stop_codon:yes gene_type:complete